MNLNLLWRTGFCSPGNGGGHEGEVLLPHQGRHLGEGDGGRLVYDDQLRVVDAGVLPWEQELHALGRGRKYTYQMFEIKKN